MKHARSRISAVGLLLFSLLSAAPAVSAGPAGPGPDAAPSWPSIVADLEALARTEMAVQKVPGLAFAIVQGDALVHAKGYGMKKVGGADPVGAHTVFEVGSTTKAFTSALVGMAVDEGKVTWSDPVVDHLPAFRMYDPWVTQQFRVDDLMSARSGMPGYSLDQMLSFGFSRREYADAVAFVAPTFSFRAGFGYVNSLWQWASFLVEKQMGLRWEDAMARRILGPLGMTESTVDPEVVPLLDDVATGHLRLADGSPWPIPSGWPYTGWIDTAGPAGSLRSNVVDMSKWIRMHLAEGKFEGKTILSPGTVSYLHAGRTAMSSSGAASTSYALGWASSSREQGPVVWHDGDTIRMVTVVALYPSANVGLVVLTNAGGNTVGYALERRLYDLLFPPAAGPTSSATGGAGTLEPFDLPPAGPPRAGSLPGAATPPSPDGVVPPLPLSRYAGSYSNPAYGAVVVREEKGALVLAFGPKGIPLAATHFSGNVFRLTRPEDPVWETAVTFVLPSGAPASRLQIEGLEDVNGGWFERKATYAAALEEARQAAKETLAGGDVTGIAVVLVDADGLLFAEGYGVADAAKSRPPTATTMFGLGSVTKMFAATAVMQLVDRGLVDLDAPLVRYVPSFRMLDPGYRGITVRMLMDHSSGLPGTDYRNAFTQSPYPGYLDQVLAAASTSRLKAPPGYMSVYCNDGFTLLESLVEGMTGRPFTRYVEEEVLAPLGMESSRFPHGPFPEGSFAHAFRGGVVQPQEFVSPLASGGLYSSAADMAKFLRVFLNKGAAPVRILSPASVAAMAVDQTQGTFNPVKSLSWSFGLGWDTVAQPGLAAVGVKGWSKGGDSGVYHAWMIVAPGEKLAVVVLFASGGSPLAFAERVLLRALAENGRIAAFPDPIQPKVLPVAKVPDGLLAAIAGVYARSEALFRVRPNADDSLEIALFQDGWQVVPNPLRYRTDGWFCSDASPLSAYRFVEAGGTQYLVQRSAPGYGHYFDPALFCQRVSAKPPSRPAWSRRVGSLWLAVNERSDSAAWDTQPSPAFGLAEVPELPGHVLAEQPSGEKQILDASREDARAGMTLVIPQMPGRDLEDLEVLTVEGEEWLRWGSRLYRPLGSVKEVPRGTTAAVVVGPEGYGEWRSVAESTSPVTVRLRGAQAWRLYDPALHPVAARAGDGSATLPPGKGPGFLIVQAGPGTSVAVAVE